MRFAGKVCAAALSLALASSACHAQAQDDGVLGFITLGETSLSDAAEKLNGKCEEIQKERQWAAFAVDGCLAGCGREQLQNLLYIPYSGIFCT